MLSLDIVVIIVLILTLCSSYSCMESCFTDESIAENITFNGNYIPLDSPHSNLRHVMKKCVAMCNAFSKSLPITYKSAVLYNRLCFCAEGLQKERTQQKECKQPAPCDFVARTCAARGAARTSLSKGIIDVFFQQPVRPMTNKAIKLPVIQIKGFRERFRYRWTIGEDYLCKFQHGKDQPHVFITPGYKRLSVGVKNEFTSEVTHTETIQVNEVIASVTIHITDVMKPGTKNNGTLTIQSGTNINGTLSIEFGGNKKLSMVKGDVYTFTYPMRICLQHENAVRTTLPLNKILANPSLTFYESGIFSKLEIVAERKGNLELMILRPSCNPPDSYCLSQYKCECEDLVDLTKSHKILTNYSNLNDLPTLELVKSDIIVEVKDTGYQIIELKGRDINVRRGDIVAIKISEESIVAFVEHNVPTFVYDQSDGKNEDLKFLPTHTHNLSVSPMIRPYVTKPLIFNFDITPRQSGVIFIRFYSNQMLEIAQKSAYVQDDIMGLFFVQDFPKEFLRYEDRSMEVKAQVKKGSHVTYLFKIPEWNQSITTNNTGVAKFEILNAGKITVYATAFNKISSVGTSKSFKVVHGISRRNLLVSEGNLLLGEELNVTVKVIGGTDVTLQVDFGDGTNVTEDIGNAQAYDGVIKNYRHKYTTCGEKTIRVRVRNPLTNTTSGWEEFRKLLDKGEETVNVVCSYNNISVETFPQLSNTDEGDKFVSIGLARELEVSVAIYKRDDSTYELHWGDNSSDIFNQSGDTQVIKRSHKYNTMGVYQVYINTTFRKIPVNVSGFTLYVRKCGSPRLMFSYGTRNKPEVYAKSMTKKIVGTWTYKECEKEIEPLFNFGHWILRDMNTGKVIVKQTEKKQSMDRMTVEYWIEKGTLEEGFYEIELGMKYDGTQELYKGYIRIKRSDLVAIIINGENATVSYKILTKEKVESTHNFNIDASGSLDPDWPKENINNMTFKWFCKLKSTSDKVIIAAQIANQAGYKQYNTCRYDNFTQIGNASSVLNFNTNQFLEGIEYDFKVEIKKDERYANATQTLEISKGLTPPITVKCSSSNCREKINIMDRYTLKYSCERCQPSQKFNATWVVTTISGKQFANRNNTKTGFHNPNLVIKANTLQQNETYIFTLRISFIGKPNTALFKITRKTSITPSNGACHVHRQNFTFLPRFKFTCSKWINYDQPTSYEFGYSLNGGDSNYVIINPSTTDSNIISDVILPTGLKERNYMINLRFRVMNRFGQYAEREGFIKVGEIKFKDNETVSTVMDKILQQTDLEDIGQLTASAMALSNIMHQTKIKHHQNDSDLSDEDRFHNEEKEKREKEKRMEIKSTIIKHLDKADVKSASEFEAVAGALSSITDDAEDLKDESQEKGVNLVSKLTKNMKTNNSYIMGPDRMESSMKTVFSSVSNLFTYEVKNIKGDGDSTGKPSTPKSEGNVKNLVSTLEEGFTLLADNQVSGESAIEGKTKSFSYNVQQAALNDMSNKSIGTGFKLPSVNSLFNDSMEGDSLSILNVKYEDNVFSSNNESGSNNIKSKISSLTFKSGGNEVNVTKTTSPIVIKLENKPDELKATNVSLFMPEKIKMHVVKLDSMDCNLMLNILAPVKSDNSLDVNIYVQYGRPAGRKNYDFRLSYSDGPIRLFPNNGTVNTTIGNDTVTLERRSTVHIIDNNTFVLSNFKNFTYGGHINNSRLYMAFVYNGSMPSLKLINNPYTFDIIEERGAYNLSLKSFCADCSYWDVKELKWKKDGCKIVPHVSSLHTTVCHCNHLTAFGSFFVAPNPLPTPSLALLKEGYVLFVVVGSTLLLYVVGLVFARRADRKDESKVGVSPLPDNKPEDRYLYEITVNTGRRLNAGTKSKVFINIGGDLAETGVRGLVDNERIPFQRCSADVFVMATASSLGELSFLRVFHDNSDGGWYLKTIEIVDLQTDQKYMFLAGRWLAVEMEDGQVDISLPVSGQEELEDFQYLFVNKASRDLSDAHLWFSIYGRPPRSSFTRCQRLSVAISLLFTNMVANLMFYGAVPAGSPKDENKIGSFNIDLRKIYIAVVSAAICLPVNVILVCLFRTIRPASVPQPKKNKNRKVKGFRNKKEKRDSDIHGNSKNSDKTNGYIKINMDDSSVEESEIEILEYSATDPLRVEEEETESSENNNDRNKTKKVEKKKEKFQLPHWVIYPAWVLNICVVLGSGFMVIWYGMAFGNKKSLEWLTSVTIGLIQDILVVQPVKVCIMAAFVALIIKKLEDEERSEVEKKARQLAKDEEWLHRSYTEDTKSKKEKMSYKPPSVAMLERARELRIKQIKMRAIGRELFFYLVFACVVFLLGLSVRDHHGFKLTTSMKEALQIEIRPLPKSLLPLVSNRFHNIYRKDKVWNYLDDVFIPSIYPEKWYNLDAKYENESDLYDFPNKLFLINLNSKIVTGARMRQVRVNKDSCRIPKSIEPVITIDCAGHYDRNNEDARNFDFSFKKPIDHNYFKINHRNMPWRYQKWSDLDSYPIRGYYDVYFGGGYTQEFFPKWENLEALKGLKSKFWVDRHSRALIVEFASFNGATNYFQNVEMVFEFPPTGGIIHFNTVNTFRLYNYTSDHALLILISEITFIVFMLYFTLREAREFYKQRFQYFRQFWNLVEVTNIILSILAVSFYFYRFSIARGIFSRMPDKKPQHYISMQFAAFWDLTYSNIVALVSFFVTLKFIKLLRFNRRICMLSSTLKQAWYPLSMFGIVFTIIIISCTIFANLVFGRALYDYHSFFRSLTSVMSLLLGKFSYEEFKTGNRVLGPLFFFMFSVMVNWIIMNMFIAVLNDVLEDVHNNEDLQNNEYEIVDYFLTSFKNFLGLNRKVEKKSEKKRKWVSQQQLVDYSFLESRFFTENVDQFLPGNEMKKEDLDSTVDKFIHCFNSLYFDDITVAQRMDKVVKEEIERNRSKQ